MADQMTHDPAARDARAVIEDEEPQQTLQQEPAPAARAPEIDVEEEKRRAGRGGGDMGSPALATLAANIRPDVVSTPGGLETITTQKSVDYPADPEAANVSDYIRERLAEVARSIHPEPSALEPIARDPETSPVADERSDVATREANEASIKRQEAERAAQSGESLPGEEGASQASDYIRERLAEARDAKAEREGEGAELAVIERGEGNTPAGGGGRGMF